MDFGIRLFIGEGGLQVAGRDYLLVSSVLTDLSVPEPGSVVALVVGGAGVLMRRGRRRV